MQVKGLQQSPGTLFCDPFESTLVILLAGGCNEDSESVR
jgi:hypothetical protein